MKWFFALNEKSALFDEYSRMLKVAVHTALKFTNLQPHFLYDGEENSLTDWLRDRGTEIIKCRSFLYDRLQELAEQRNQENILTIGSGAFLRTEIPSLMAELGFSDKFVLYTDVDVMFLSPVPGFESMSPKFFAVAPESDILRYKAMNSGVMLMNLENLRAQDDKFRSFISDNLGLLVDQAWDQGAYKLYYQSRIWGYRWNKLPREYNWKPYWPANENAKIIHFHGPKPYHRKMLTSGDPPPDLATILHLFKGEFTALAARWDEFAAEIDQEKSFRSL